MPQKLKQGTAYMVTGLGISMAISYISQVLASRNLGPEIYGLYGLVIANMTIVAGLIDPGMSAAMATFVAENETEVGKSGVRRIIQTGINIEIFLAFVLSLIVLTFFEPITQRFFLGNALLTWFFLILVVIQGFYGLFVGILQGLRELRGLAVVRIIEQATLFAILFLFITLALLRLKTVLPIQAISDTSALTLSVILVAWYLRRMKPSVNKTEADQVKWSTHIVPILKFAAPVAAATFATSLIQLSGPDILNLFTNNNPGNQIGILVVILTLSRVLYRILTTIFQSAFPFMVRWNTVGDIKKTKQYTSMMALLTVGACLVLIFAARLLGRWAVNLIYGSDYLSVANYLPLAIIAIGTTTLRDIYKYSLFSFKVTGYFMIVNFLGVALYFIILFAGKYWLGVQDILSLIFVSMGIANLLITLGELRLFNLKLMEKPAILLGTELEG